MSKEYVMQLESTIENYKRDNKILKEELFKYRALEEQLGCPLEVVFKALKQNYAYFKFIGKVEFIVIDSTGNELLIHSNKENVGEYLHNYKKTWWLKSDKTE